MNLAREKASAVNALHITNRWASFLPVTSQMMLKEHTTAPFAVLFLCGADNCE
jgi:hypothetical protein